MMTVVPRAQEIYRHFKGDLYQIVTLAEHTETGETLVIYQALYGEFKVYARPLSLFCSKVDKEKYPNATQEYRFALQSFTQEPVKQEKVAETTAETSMKKQEAAEDIITETTKVIQAEEEDESAGLDPILLAFLDADTYGEKLNILSGMQHRITDDMITTMAIACDIEIGEGDLENRFMQLKNCLLTLDKYEITR